MVIAVIVSVAAEARVAGVVVVLQWLVVMVVNWFVVVVNRDSHWDLHRHWDRDGFLHWDVLLDVHRVWAVEGDLHWDGHGLLNGVGDLGKERGVLSEWCITYIRSNK